MTLIITCIVDILFRHSFQLTFPSSNVLLILSPTLALQVLHPGLRFTHPFLRPLVHLVPLPIS
jgi:hypothetical protein